MGVDRSLFSTYPYIMRENPYMMERISVASMVFL